MISSPLSTAATRTDIPLRIPTSRPHACAMPGP